MVTRSIEAKKIRFIINRMETELIDLAFCVSVLMNLCVPGLITSELMSHLIYKRPPFQNHRTAVYTSPINITIFICYFVFFFY